MIHAIVDIGKVLMAINERLKAIRTALKLSQRVFCKDIFLEHSGYSRMEQGVTRVNERIIELICTKYNVSREYLKNGKGDMFTDNSPPDVKLEQLRQLFNELNPLFQDYLLLQAKELLKVQGKAGG